MKIRVLRLRSKFLRSHLDNIVFRHEIGMDSLGRLRKGSPIRAAHLIMLAVLATVALSYLIESWTGVLYSSGAALLVLALLAYPIAYRRGFLSIHRERVAGTLEQLFLTLLSSRELFDGKFFGSLAPFFEIRRYLMLLSAMFCASVWTLLSGPECVVAVALCLTIINHFGYCAYLGVLGGLKVGGNRVKMRLSVLADVDLSPWPHVWLIVKHARYFFFILILLGGVGRIAFASSAPAYALASLALALTFRATYKLQDREHEEMNRLALTFKKNIRFDISP